LVKPAEWVVVHFGTYTKAFCGGVVLGRTAKVGLELHHYTTLIVINGFARGYPTTVSDVCTLHFVHGYPAKAVGVANADELLRKRAANRSVHMFLPGYHGYAGG